MPKSFPAGVSIAIAAVSVANGRHTVFSSRFARPRSTSLNARIRYLIHHVERNGESQGV